MSDKKILVLAPTFMEIEGFMPHCMPNVNIAVTGIGVIKTAYNTTRYTDLYECDTAILAGIAGAYEGSGLKVGDSVLISSETTADMGVMTPEGFSPRFSEKIVCPYIPEGTSFRTAESNCVSTAATPMLAYSGAQIENMEGAAFFYACQQSQVRFLELRTVSNIVSTDRSSWNMELALLNLANDLRKLINEIEA